MKPLAINIPSKVFFGIGQIQLLKEILQLNKRKILIVTDENLFTNTEVIQKVRSILSGNELFYYTNIEENPSIETIENGATVFKKFKIDMVLGVGGGSCMDAAKGISVLLNNPGSLHDYIGRKELQKDSLPIICIPTTSGTGSEVTPFAVFTDRVNGTKNALVHDKIYPTYSIIDPELTFTMPKTLILDTGLDALGHCLEAYLSTLSTVETQKIALDAIKTIVANLKKASDKEPDAMSKMAYASMIGGLAISQASTILPHIMGYPLTVYHQIPHGPAGMILMPAFLKRLENQSTIKPKIKILNQVFSNEKGLSGFLNDLGVPMKLSEYGVKKSDLHQFVAKVIGKDDIKITPMEVTEKEIYELYLASFD